MILKMCLIVLQNKSISAIVINAISINEIVLARLVSTDFNYAK